MIFGIMSLGTLIFLIVFSIARAALTVYSRDVYPYSLKDVRPPLYDVFTKDTSHSTITLESHTDHIKRIHAQNAKDTAELHQQFLCTDLGKIYLQLLKD